MRFLLDENVERSIAIALQQEGYDIACVGDECPGAPDHAVLNLACREKRILVTNDTDFGEMVVRQGILSSGVVLMRFSSEEISRKIATLKHLLAHHREKLHKHFVVINEKQIKIRPL